MSISKTELFFPVYYLLWQVYQTVICSEFISMFFVALGADKVNLHSPICLDKFKGDHLPTTTRISISRHFPIYMQ